MSGLGTLLLLSLLTAAPAAGAQTLAAPCMPDKRAEILQPADVAAAAATLDCSLTLGPDDVVTKVVRIEAGGVTLDCNGALLDGRAGTPNEGRDILVIRSRRRGGDWQRPENVSVRNCRISGSMRIYGMAMNGEGTLLRDSSRLPGHVARARAAAPRRILLDRLHISGTGRIPLYLSPGVSEVTLRDSILDGLSRSTGIYLDAESTGNIIEHNMLAVDARREQIAVDGSSHNLIRDNDFYALRNGGVFLYRNCGEGGTIRHSTPSYNRILDNRFQYLGKRAVRPAIDIGSRDGQRLYCDLDSGYAFGSSADDRDFATHNTVAGNRFIGLDGGDAIRIGGETNRPNEVQAVP